MKKILFLSSLLLLGLSTNGCVKEEMSPQVLEQSVPQSEPQLNPTPMVTTPIPSTPVTLGKNYQLKSVQGSFVSIQEQSNGFVFPQYQDKTVLLQIFGKECEYCFKEMPFLHNMESKYGQKLNIIALQAQNNMRPSVARNIIQKFQINYPIIDRDEANDLLFFIKRTYGWNGVLPYMLLIKNGVTEYSFSGEVDHHEFEESIRSLL